jgi:hypothetical protein
VASACCTDMIPLPGFEDGSFYRITPITNSVWKKKISYGDSPAVRLWKCVGRRTNVDNFKIMGGEDFVIKITPTFRKYAAIPHMLLLNPPGEFGLCTYSSATQGHLVLVRFHFGAGSGILCRLCV